MRSFIDRSLYALLLVTLIFGVILYDIIGFKSMDELCGAVLLVLFLYSFFKSENWEINKAFLFVLSVFSFYTVYSFVIGSNTKKAIVMDLIIQMKPYLAFFCVYQLKPSLTQKQMKLINDLMVVFWLFLLPVGLIGFFNEGFIRLLMKHPTYFAASVTAVSLVYLFSSDYTKKSKLIFILMLTIGLASGRSKFYGFYILSIFSILYFHNSDNLRFSWRNTFAIVGLLSVIVFVARDKLIFYFGYGLAQNGDVSIDYVARFVLYATSLKIFVDFLPFGSGLASFATYASGAYYSPMYSHYNIDKVWGISKQNYSFIADTYYPSLAQFGLVGVLLFALFWFYVLRKAYAVFLRNETTKTFVLVMLITGYCLIENIADASFTSNRGFFMLMFMGFVIAGEQRKARPVIPCKFD